MTTEAQAHLFPFLPTARLDGTRTSARWTKGNMDRLNLRAIFPQCNEWGIPEVAADDFEPEMLAAYHEPRQRDRAADAGGAVHFFLDDCRFEAVWNRPEAAAARIARVGAALTPDFSLWREMPLAAQIWQVYRNRWCGAYWQYAGIRVIPTIGWSTPESYPFAFVGVPHHSAVAVSAVGVRDAESRALFADGMAAMVETVHPSAIYAYGPLPDMDVALPMVRTYETDWAQRRL